MKRTCTPTHTVHTHAHIAHPHILYTHMHTHTHPHILYTHMHTHTYCTHTCTHCTLQRVRQNCQNNSMHTDKEELVKDTCIMHDAHRTLCCGLSLYIRPCSEDVLHIRFLPCSACKYVLNWSTSDSYPAVHANMFSIGAHQILTLQCMQICSQLEHIRFLPCSACKYVLNWSTSDSYPAVHANMFSIGAHQILTLQCMQICSQLESIVDARPSVLSVRPAWGQWGHLSGLHWGTHLEHREGRAL